MTIVAYIIIVFTGIQFLVALVNLLFRAVLPKSKSVYSELVSVLIPARNEEENIGNILNDLINQEYRNIEIIVFDDQSDDRTREITEEYVHRDNRISIISSDGLPDGWLGKNHACHSLSKYSEGSFLLFVDADVHIKRNTIGNAVAMAKRYDLALISIFPKQEIKSFGERVTVPNMNYILLSLLPLVFVRTSKFTSLSAANGQFMFFRSDIYKTIEPHSLMRKERVEDISIARYFKKEGLKIACLTGDKNISCRMYTGFKDAVKGFSKNVIAFFGNSFIIAVMFWLITTIGFIPVLFFLPAGWFAAYITAYLLIRIMISASSHQNILYNLIFIIPLQISLGIFIYRAFINRFFKSFEWKGRSIK